MGMDGWKLHFAFFDRKVEVCGEGALKGMEARWFHQGGLDAPTEQKNTRAS